MAQRQQTALSLTLQGASARQVAAKMLELGMAPKGYGAKTVSRDLGDILSELTEENRDRAEELRMIDYYRLQAIIQAQWPFAIKDGDPGAAGIIMQAMREQRELMGVTQHIRDKFNQPDRQVEFELKWPEEESARLGKEATGNILQLVGECVEVEDATTGTEA